MDSLNYGGTLIKRLIMFFASDEEGYPLYIGVVKEEAIYNSIELLYTELVVDRHSYPYFHHLKDKKEPPYSSVILFPMMIQKKRKYDSFFLSNRKHRLL